MIKVKGENKYKLFLIGYISILVILSFIRFPDVRNELKYFVITEEMLKNKNYMILHYFNELYPDKPPIYFWILASIKNIFPKYFYPLSLIVGSLLPCGIVGLINFKLVKLFWNKKMAYISTMVYITLPYIMGVSLFLRMDFLMTMFISMGIFLFFSFYYKKIPINRLTLLGFYLSLVLGVLVKGGAGIAIPLITILTFLYFEKNFKFLKEIKFKEGMLIILIILGIWLYGIFLNPQGEQYIKLLLGRETIGRMIKAKTHTKAIYYYLEQILLLMLPITLFFLGGIYNLLKKIRNFKNFTVVEKIALSWFLPNFIFFSLLSGKLAIYMLPILLPGVLISLDYIENNFPLNKEKILKWIIGINMIVLSIIIFLLPYYNNNYTLKPVINFLKDKKENIVTYKFTDGKNISCYLKRKELKDIPLEQIKKLPNNTYIISRKKYGPDVEKIGYTSINLGNYVILLKRDTSMK